MIGLPLDNFKSPVYLLQQHHPHKLVGEGHWGEGELEVRPLHHFFTEAQRAANYEGYIAPALYSRPLMKSASPSEDSCLPCMARAIT